MVTSKGGGLVVRSKGRGGEWSEAREGGGSDQKQAREEGVVRRDNPCLLHHHITPM